MPQDCGPCCWFMSNCQTSSVIFPQSRPRGLLDSASIHSKRQNWFNSRSIWVSFGFPYWWSFSRVGWLRLGDHYTVPRRDQPSATLLPQNARLFLLHHASPSFSYLQFFRHLQCLFVFSTCSSHYRLSSKESLMTLLFFSAPTTSGPILTLFASLEEKLAASR